MPTVCWADKAALLFAVLLLFALFVIGEPTLATTDDPGGWAGAYVSIFWHLAQMTVLPLWIFLRAIDLVLGGPTRRAAKGRLQ
jgi:hypothetical protein